MRANEICHVDTTSFHDELNTEKFPFESDRYWLFSSKLCPFAHRTEIVRKWLDLADVVGLTIAGSIQTERGWNLEEPYEYEESAAPNPVKTAERIPAIYKLSESDYTGRASVPVLFDIKTNTIVNNESAQIVLQLDDVAVRQYQHSSLYPFEKRKSIDSFINTFSKEFVSPIYRAGFAKDQQAYHLNFTLVFTYLNKLNEQLSKTGPYIVGEMITLADVHAFPHLSRFDSVFHSLYRLNQNYISEFTHVSHYMERLGMIPAFASTLDIEELKKGYYLSWNQPTNGYFVPEGPEVNPHSGIALVN